MKKSELIRRLEHLRCDPTGVFLEELIEELKEEKSKPGWVLSRWAGGKETFMVSWDVWSIWIRDAYIFAKREAALLERDHFEGLNDGRKYEACRVILEEKSGRVLRRAKP